jgi:hypothetical protein
MRSSWHRQPASRASPSRSASMSQESSAQASRQSGSPPGGSLLLVDRTGGRLAGGRLLAYLR